jgi:hypothetical protein
MQFWNVAQRSWEQYKFNTKSNSVDTGIFLTHLRSYVNVPEQEFMEFLKLLVPLQLKKDEHFYRAGEVPRYSPFILKGCLRQYVGNDSVLDTPN